MIAAAEIAGSSPILAEMPMSPTPIVPTTVQELPIASETTAQSAAEVT